MQPYRDERPGRQVIQAYGDGGFRIAGRRHEGAVLILPEITLPWPVAALSAVTIASLATIVAANPPVAFLLLGCGPDFAPAPASLRSALRGHGIGLDVMATAAACRTFNVMLAEDRRVAAALLPV